MTTKEEVVIQNAVRFGHVKNISFPLYNFISIYFPLILLRFTLK